MQILLLLRLFGMVAIAEHKKGDRSKLRSPFLLLVLEFFARLRAIKFYNPFVASLLRNSALQPGKE